MKNTTAKTNLPLCALVPLTADTLQLAQSIVSQGRQFQNEQGFVQWQPGFPSLEIIEQDYASKSGFFLEADGEKAGYACLPDVEPAYDTLDGEWKYGENFLVIHRLSLGSQFQNCGLSGPFMKAIEDYARQCGKTSVRIDTHPDNLRMQHIIARHGYRLAGEVIYEIGMRIAYEKKLDCPSERSDLSE